MTDFTAPIEPAGMLQPLPAKPRGWGRLLGWVLFLVVLTGAAVAAFVYLPQFRKEPKAPGNKSAEKQQLPVELVEGKPETLRVPEQVRKALGIEDTYRVEVPREGKPLLMPASTDLDPARVRRIRSRFNGDVIELMQVKGYDPKSDHEIGRDIRSGDTVYGGDKNEVLAEVFGLKIKRPPDVLAVIWSLEVGMRKSDLADAIVQLRLDEQRLRDRTELWKNGNLPLDLLNQTRRDVITDQNNVDRAERNLEVWKVPASEVKEVRDEAEAAFLRQGVRDKNKERLWARSAIVAPLTGTIIESNLGGVGEFLPDSTVNLFIIADVDRLRILAYPSEDQLPLLTALKPGQMRWTVKTVGLDPVDAPIEDISYILDPNQHTPVVKGYIDNPHRKLRAGQFATCSVKMPVPDGVVEIPLTALAEDGRMSFVFIQPDPESHDYTMRRVQVVRRFEDTAYVRSEMTTEERELNEKDKKQGLPPREPLRPGERILTSGVLELRSALDDLSSKVAKEK